MTHQLYASKSQDLDTQKLATPSRQRRTRLFEEKKVDTEAGMLSGISRKRSMRSRSYWFTEFCNSQCLSHFAAPFIVVRAETSIAESCKWNKQAISNACNNTIILRVRQVTAAKRQGGPNPEEEDKTLLLQINAETSPCCHNGAQRRDPHRL
jgi:predicted ABC-class ATPase